jgi:hypothetical protein
VTTIPIQECQHRGTYCWWPHECPAKCERREFFDEYCSDAGEENHDHTDEGDQ